MQITLSNYQIEFTPWRPEDGQVFTTPFSLDTETTLIDDDHPWFVPTYVLGAVCDGEQGFFLLRQFVAPFLEVHQEVEVIMHNAPFDLSVLQAVAGTEADVYQRLDKNLVWDTQLLHKLLCLGTAGHVARGKDESTLEHCAELYLGIDLPKDVCDEAGNDVRLSYGKLLGIDPSSIPLIYLEYLAKDTLVTYLVYQQLQTRLQDLRSTSQTAFAYTSDDWLDEQIAKWGPQTHHIQLKGAVVLDQIHRNGLHVDLDKVHQLKAMLEAEREALQAQLRDYGYLPGEGSDKALQSILSRLERSNPGLQLPRTATGKISSTAESLEGYRGDEPFVALYLRYKAVNSFISTFVSKLGRGVLHPRFNPLVESGRTSSFGDINAQNLPRDGEIRGCIVPSPGHVFVDADYSTLELATLAQTVQTVFGIESEMGRLINDGVDLHRHVAAQVTGKPQEEVSKDDRQRAKAFNFGKPGGMGIKGLIRYAKASYGVQFSEEEAKDQEYAWLSLFPEMEVYLNERLDAGVELAYLADLTPFTYTEHTGIRCEGDEDLPVSWLGWMCLKVAREHAPATKLGRAYTQAEIDYFWERLNECVDAFPTRLHDDVQIRRPSVNLYHELRNELTRGPVITITGRVRANAGHCQQRNTPFQGLAADGAKLALWKLFRRGFRIVNFVHDEILIEVPLGSEHLQGEVAELMMQAMQEVVPDIWIGVESKVVSSWSKDAEHLSQTARAA